MSIWKKSLLMWWVQMNKFKKLTWFAAFCSLFQYTRDRKIIAYLLANVFGCVIPALILVGFFNGKLDWSAYIWCNAAARLAFAPLDEYASDEYAYTKLTTFPLNIFEMLWVRLVAKLTQVSEWIFAVSVGYVYSTVFGMHQAAALAVLTVVGLQLTEEIVFYLVWLIRKNRALVALYLAMCAGIAGASLTWPMERSAVLTAYIWCGVLALSVAAMLVLHGMWYKLRPLCGKPAAEKNVHIPLSTRLMQAASGRGILFRLVCMEWVCMLKLKVWELVSALGYVAVFAAMDRSGNLLYALVQYFIVDYCFLMGFNYFGIINDREGLFLFNTVDRKLQLKSKNLALSTVLLAISGVLTVVLGVVFGVDGKTLILTILTNLFCISVMVLCSSIVSILHFHLNESKKKYSVSNMVIMLTVLILSSVLTSFVLAGGMLGAISLIFMAVMTLTCVYFGLIDVSLLADLYHRREEKMIAVMRN